MSEKIAWVIPGGGSRSAYTAGLVYFANKFNLTKPNIIITASGGAGGSFYYLADQGDEIPKVWLDILPTKKFANVWRFWKFADINFLIDEVFKKIKPINIEKVKKSDVLLYVATNNYKTGEIKFFNNRDNVDLLEVMRATKRAPVFSGLKLNPVKIEEEYFIDSRVTSHSELLIQKAIDEGAQKIIVFDNYYKWSSFVSGNLMFKLWLLFQNKTFRKKQLQYLEILNNFQIPKNKDILVIRPQKRLRILPWSNNKKDLERIFHQAEQDFNDVYPHISHGVYGGIF
ncbi:MAG: patatin-like phospholipase family protein [Candidatus Paceibacterota bacterium]|jgi:predicted patatin/cPLA2 family phospholipase